MTNEINLILKKIKLVSEIEEQGAYICDKEHSKILYDYITNLQEENKTLKELNICVGCNNNPDYKSRNEKAIEYINKQEDYYTNYPLVDRKHILNILGGDDNE